MSTTRFPKTTVKNEVSMEGPDGALSLHQAAKVHKQHTNRQNINAYPLPVDSHQKYQVNNPRHSTEYDLHHNKHRSYDFQSPQSSTFSAASPSYQQICSPFVPSSGSSQTTQYPFNSPPMENQIQKTESQEALEGAQVARGLNGFVNLYTQQQQPQMQTQALPPNVYYHLRNPMTTPINALGYQPNSSPIYMNNAHLQAQPSANTNARKRERFDELSYADEPFAPPHEACSFTWDIKEDRTISENQKPKRRKLTASERARTKALKLAGGACDNCRRKKKKCTHKDLSDFNSLGEGQLMDGDLTQRHDKPPTTTDQEVQSRLYPYSGPNNSVLAYMGPEDDPGMDTPGTPSYVGETFNAPEFPLESAGLDQHFDHQTGPENHDQGQQEGVNYHYESGVWYNALGFNADYVLYPYHQG